MNVGFFKAGNVGIGRNLTDGGDVHGAIERPPRGGCRRKIGGASAVCGASQWPMGTSERPNPQVYFAPGICHNCFVMTVLPHVFVLVVLFCAVTLTGCREKGAASPAVDSGPARAKPRVADNRQTLSEEPAVLTERQRRAFDSIVSAGGGIDQDADGRAVGIDLASDRVLADEATVRAVLEFPHLKRLHLAVSKVSQKTLAGLASLRELEELLLQDAPLDDAALAKLLLAAPDLQRLTLRRLNQVTDAGLSALPECKELEVVALIEMSGITGAALDALRRVERMRSLDVRNCGQLTTADFAQLASLPALAELKVGGPAVNDQVLGILAKHPADLAVRG